MCVCTSTTGILAEVGDHSVNHWLGFALLDHASHLYTDSQSKGKSRSF